MTDTAKGRKTVPMGPSGHRFQEYTIFFDIAAILEAKRKKGEDWEQYKLTEDQVFQLIQKHTPKPRHIRALERKVKQFMKSGRKPSTLWRR